MMITIVDDDPSVRRALKRLLHSAGYEVETFSCAEEFFASQNEACVCLILDIHLGGISGFDLQQRLISQQSKLPVIFITAHDDEYTRQQAMNLNPVAYLRKPIDAQILIEAIHVALSPNR